MKDRLLLSDVTHSLKYHGSISVRKAGGRDSLSPESKTINEALNSTDLCPHPTSRSMACIQTAEFGLVGFSLTYCMWAQFDRKLSSKLLCISHAFIFDYLYCGPLKRLSLSIMHSGPQAGISHKLHH